MRVLIIGANGFLGQTLCKTLIDKPIINGQKIEQLLLLDEALQESIDQSWIKGFKGDLTEVALIRRILADGIDLVFHVACLPDGLAEQDYSLGFSINVQGAIEVLNQLRQMANCPTFIYTSSIEVYGSDLPMSMDENYPPKPELSFGNQKLMVEMVIRDLSRRGEINGHALRLPSIVCRPPSNKGFKTAFMSDLIRAFATSTTYECPVSARASGLWMSARCCVKNLIHAAGLDSQNETSVWQLPALHLTVADVIKALCDVFDEKATLICFKPDSELEALFGRYPDIQTARADRVLFCHDGNEVNLVKNALFDANLLDASDAPIHRVCNNHLDTFHGAIDETTTGQRNA